MHPLEFDTVLVADNLVRVQQNVSSQPYAIVGNFQRLVNRVAHLIFQYRFPRHGLLAGLLKLGVGIVEGDRGAFVVGLVHDPCVELVGRVFQVAGKTFDLGIQDILLLARQ